MNLHTSRTHVYFLATRELPPDGDATIELSAAWRDLLQDVIKLDESSAAWRDLLLDHSACTWEGFLPVLAVSHSARRLRSRSPTNSFSKNPPKVSLVWRKLLFGDGFLLGFLLRF